MNTLIIKSFCCNSNSMKRTTMRTRQLRRKIDKLERQLDQKVNVAMYKCNPYDINTFDDDECDVDCAVLWHTIEDLSNNLHDKQNEMACINFDIIDYNDCWNSIECRLFNL